MFDSLFGNIFVFHTLRYFNFLCQNEKLSFCLMCVFTNNPATLSILDIICFVLSDFVGKTNASRRMFILATSLKK